MSDKLEEIKARHNAAEIDSIHRPRLPGKAHDDRAWLLGEVERQAQHIEELQSKIDAEKSCACSYDAPGDICAAHSPALAAARAEVERLTRERDEARAEVERLRKALEGGR